MSLAFIFGVHNHQPLGNFDQVVDEAVRRAYRPFLQTLSRFPEVRVLVHTSGLLLEWWEAHAPDLLDLMAELAGRGQIEPLTGGLTEPILPLLPDHDKVAQIRALTDRVAKRLGVRPRGMWLAERVWEPHLARPLAEAGVEYVLVDDHHFGMAGLDPEQLSGYYLTEEQGHGVAVFPIAQGLRYQIPFAPVEQVFATLAERAGRGGALTMVDDGEKFGVWPNTHRLVYEQGWLERFFGGLTRVPGVALLTAAEYLDREPPTDRVYLPATSYREMTEWVLTPEAAAEVERARRALEGVAGPAAARLLRGGFWRNFLVRYPEVNDIYRKMLRVSRRVAAGLAGRPSDPVLLAARDLLWRGQCNDAYWHGIFGGVYLPHLRRAVKGALLGAEATLDRAEGLDARVVHETGDLDGDGAAEIAIRSERLAVLLRPAAGGTVTELAYRPLAFDLADVLTRRRELSHLRIAEAERASAEGHAMRTIHETWSVKEAGLGQLLGYDAHRRACLQDYLLEPDGPADPARAWIAFPAHRCVAAVDAAAERVAVTLRAAALVHDTRVELTKVLDVARRGAGLGVRYAVRAERAIAARLAVRWNLTLSGPGLERYYRGEDGEIGLLEAAGEREGERVALVDDWLGLTATLTWSPRARILWTPVYTVSLSETGLERVWQGVELTVVWPLELGPDGWEGRMGLGLEAHRKGA
ncbi:MAG TPA: alpha-amylase/4-alpha-glucanotransferase domain-containing protein [Methylomirabilota bacterium]|nr:alpha-amylase/4-alpha-glucanotransferase domain-containing protein [Methylomirabilota bacterium]